MNLNICDIYTNLKDYINYSNFDPSSLYVPLTDLKFIIKDQSEFKNKYIYLSTTKFITENKIKINSSHVILIEDNDKDDYENYLLENCTFIILNKECEIYDIFNKVNDIFTQSNFLNALSKNKDLTNIADMVAQYLDNPVVIVDCSYRILANSDIFSFKDEYWFKNISQGYCTYEFITYIRNIDSFKNSLDNTIPFKVICDENSIERFVTKVFYKNTLIAYIVLLQSNSPLDDKYRTLLPKVSDLVSNILSNDNNIINTSDKENLLLDLLDENIKNEDILAERLKSYNIKFNTNFCILALDVNKFNSNNNIKGYLSNTLDTLFFNKTHMYYKEYIVILYDYDNEFMSQEKMEKFSSFVSENNIIVGVSNTFKDLLNCKLYLNQSISSINLSNKLNKVNSINYYKDVLFYDFLDKSNNISTNNDFVHPCLKILRDFDIKNNTELYNTLGVYLSNGKNSNLTSDKLFIHRNTLKYRINKIIELTNIDFNNFEEVFNIHFSYKYLKFNSV